MILIQKEGLNSIINKEQFFHMREPIKKKDYRKGA